MTCLVKNGLVAGTGGVTVESIMKTLPRKCKVSGLTLIALSLLSFTSFSVHADTNIIAVLTTADGISYTNARIDRTTPVEAFVWYDGGIARVPLTNLPESLKQKYPFDTNAASQFLAAEKQKTANRRAAEIAAAAARQAWLEKQAKNAGWINIIGSDRQKPNPQYTAVINGTATKIYLNNPPKGLDEEVGYFSMKKMHAESDYVVSVLQGDRFNEMVAVQNGKAAEVWMPRVRAFDTGTKYSGIPVWQFVPKSD